MSVSSSALRNYLRRGLASTIILLISFSVYANDVSNEIAIKSGSREALTCFRQSENQHYPVDTLHRFAPCIKASDFGDETSTEDHLLTFTKHAAAYYLAFTNFGQMTQGDYGTLGVANMKYLTGTGVAALRGLEALGYAPDKICAILSWLDCTKFKALPKTD